MPNTSSNIKTATAKAAEKSSSAASTRVQRAPTALTPEQESAVISRYLVVADQERLQCINASPHNGSTISYISNLPKWVAPIHSFRPPTTLTTTRRTRLKTISPAGSRFHLSSPARETLYLPLTKGLQRRNAIARTEASIPSRTSTTIKSLHPTHSGPRIKRRKNPIPLKGVPSLEPP